MNSKVAQYVVMENLTDTHPFLEGLFSDTISSCMISVADAGYLEGGF